MSQLLPFQLLFSLIVTSTFGYCIDTTKFTSIQTLIEEKKVQASITGLGGYSGECVQIAVKNNTADSSFVWIESGRRFASENEAEQDLFIAKSAVLTLGPGQVDSVSLYGFCCQSKNQAPKRFSKFSIGAMAPIAWVVLARFIEKHDFPKSAIQKAVWVMSDGHELGSIFDEDKNKIAPLKRKVAEIKGIPIPWYSFTYVEREDVVFSDEPNYLHGDIDFYVPTHCAISAVIKNPYGQNVAYPIRQTMHGPGDYTLKLKTNVQGWESGKYVVWILQDFNVPITRRTFHIK